MTDPSTLSRLEREIMEVLYALGEGSAAEVAGRLEDQAGLDSIRVTLAILEKKGHVRARRSGRRNIYTPAVSHAKATRFAVRDLMRTFFRGSPKRAILTLLDMNSSRLSKRELDEIAAWIEEERERKP